LGGATNWRGGKVKLLLWQRVSGLKPGPLEQVADHHKGMARRSDGLTALLVRALLISGRQIFTADPSICPGEDTYTIHKAVALRAGRGGCPAPT
jgi:hypothetical protein